MNKKVLSGEMSYRDSFAAMLKSVPLPFPKCAELLRDSKLILLLWEAYEAEE